MPEYNLSDDHSNNLSNILSNVQSDNLKYFDAWYQTYMVRIMKINDNLLFFGGIKEIIPPKVAKDFRKFIISKCI